MTLLPRAIAATPVRETSARPSGRISSRKASSLSVAPVSSKIKLSVVASITRELFLGVPRELREGALAMGTTRWEMIKGVVFPYARGGIAAALILGLGRAIGEAIAVTQVIGGGVFIHWNLFSTGDTLASPNAGVLMPTVPLSEPLFAVAIAPAQRLDEAKLSQALQRLIDEDPALRVARADFTNELQLLGSGETHVATATSYSAVWRNANAANFLRSSNVNPPARTAASTPS